MEKIFTNQISDLKRLLSRILKYLKSQQYEINLIFENGHKLPVDTLPKKIYRQPISI